ncbi:MAG: hypothetical protein JSW46_07450 [Gemmatimonadota bacterium]|nr:MAG: hypothetical protein JSW46_07450 [Gemmatimonadota bacterium]
MPGIRKLKAVRAVVRPDKRDEYLERWKTYVVAAQAAGAQVWLYEDQVLPGRFFEFTQHEAAEGMEGKLEGAFREADVKGVCVRREGDEVLYREVVLGGR